MGWGWGGCMVFQAWQWTAACCLDAAWQTGRGDKLDCDRDRCVKAEWHRHKKVISAPRQPKAYEVSLYRVSIRGAIYRGPRPLLEYKHLTEVGYRQTAVSPADERTKEDVRRKEGGQEDKLCRSSWWLMTFTTLHQLSKTNVVWATLGAFTSPWSLSCSIKLGTKPPVWRYFAVDHQTFLTATNCCFPSSINLLIILWISGCVYKRWEHTENPPPRANCPKPKEI